MATILIFVRHGESEGNKKDSFNGSINVPLTEVGQQQALLTAKYLDRYDVDAVYSSDLIRAFDTAKAIADRRGLQVITNKKLREIFGGKFEGVKYADILEAYPEAYHMWLNDMANCQCPEGESVKELFLRVSEAVLEIANKHKDQTVVITSHGTPIKSMSTLWYKKDLSTIRDFPWVKNASVTVVNYDDIENPQVLMYDEHEHLKELLTELPTNV